jgi:FkbM family methyltransferase
MLYQKLNKPEYWFRPGQIFKKLENICGRYSSITTTNVRLPWGSTLQVNPHETIGHNLVTLGVYELAVSEILWRLTEPGDWCLDIGANIGYMTSLLAARAQAGGRVSSFEPHPLIFGRLQANLKNCVNGNNSPIQANQIAIGAADGKTHLVEPDGFNNNEGNAMLTDNLLSDKKSHQIDISRLDSLFCAREQFGVVKIDVEGWELSVFEGAKRLLAEKRIRDIVFEDFAAFPSDSVKCLQNNGFTVFGVAKRILGPLIWNPSKTKSTDLLLPYEPVNYLATINPGRALKLLQPRGWFCLKAKTPST